MAKKKKKVKHQYAGEEFASKAEMLFAQQLDKKKIEWKYEPDKFNWIPPVKTRKYTPDFKIKRRDKYEFYIEFKGYLRPKDRTKIKNCLEQNPSLDLRIVFMDANKPIYKGSPTSYGMWAEKLGIQWAEKDIPKEWLRNSKKKKHKKGKKV